MDPYNQYPTYPFTVSDETGYYSPGGDHHEEPYSPEPQEYSYTAQHDLEPGQRAGATVDDTLKGAESLQPPDASPLPQITEQLDIYETNLEKSGENLSY